MFGHMAKWPGHHQVPVSLTTLREISGVSDTRLSKPWKKGIMIYPTDSENIATFVIELLFLGAGFKCSCIVV